MIVYMFKIQNSLIFDSVNLTNLSQATKLNSVYIFSLYGTSSSGVVTLSCKLSIAFYSITLTILVTE